MINLYIRLSIKINACSSVTLVHAPLSPIEIFKISIHLTKKTKHIQFSSKGSNVNVVNTKDNG
jgi:hypothetical protein